MVFYDLIVRIVSENIKEIRIKDSYFEWYFKLNCVMCQSEQPNEIYFTNIDEIEMQNGHGTANFIMNCKYCSKKMSISIYNKSKLYISCENGNDEEVLATFDSRGCEITKWSPKEGFNIMSMESEKCFEDVDLNDIWCEYDEIAGINCSLLEPVNYRIEKNKSIK
jgi:hypothetical protein